MTTIIRFSFSVLVLFTAMSTMAADARDEVLKAARSLGEAANYSWRTTIENANGGVRRGPTDGATEKGGYTTWQMEFGGNVVNAVIQGTNATLKTSDSDWQSAADLAQNDTGAINPAVFIARTLPNLQTPAVEAVTFAGYAQNLTAGTNGITGDLTDEGAKNLILFRRGNGNSAGSSFAASNAKGTVTFWLADGKLVKYQTHVTGTMTFNGNDRDVDRTTTTVISDVGGTKIELPDGARKKLETKPE
jgi:hypothetical protein